jgi:uncharacterized protein (DUF1778 family)
MTTPVRSTDEVRRVSLAPLAVEVPPETRLAIERAAAAQGMSVSEFIQDTLQRLLVEIGSRSEPLN